MSRGIFVRALVLGCMVLGFAYVDAGADGEPPIRDCEDYNFSVCMEGWECMEQADCDDMVLHVPCVTVDASCGWHILCLGNNPRLTCKYEAEVH